MASLLTMRQAAEELQLSIHTLRAWCSQRKLPFVKLGRRVLLRREDLESFVKRNVVEAKGK
jgi:excisionase family DNA binding protein